MGAGIVSHGTPIACPIGGANPPDPSVLIDAATASADLLVGVNDALLKEGLAAVAKGMVERLMLYARARHESTSTQDGCFREADALFAHDSEWRMAVRALLLKMARAVSRVHECMASCEADLSDFLSRCQGAVDARCHVAVREASRCKQVCVGSHMDQLNSHIDRTL